MGFIGQLRKNLMQRKEAGDLFGREKERGVLKGILRGIEQTFGGSELYPNIEEKAAHLLTSLSKTIRSSTATSASPLSCLFGF